MHAGAALAAAEPVEEQRQFDVLIGVEHRHQGEELEDKADFGAAHIGTLGGVEPGHVLAVDTYDAAVRLVETAHQLQQRGLARARGADKGSELAGVDAERYAVEGARFHLADLVTAGDVFDLDYRREHSWR